MLVYHLYALPVYEIRNVPFSETEAQNRNHKMSHIENLKAFDPFADAAKGENEGVQDGLVHVR